MILQANIKQILQAVPWFLELKPFQIERLGCIAMLRQVEKDVVIFREGEREDTFYVLLEGQIGLDIYIPSHGSRRIYTAEPLDIIGWSSLTPMVRQRTVTARALVASKLVAINGEDIRRLCDEDHDIGYIIIRRVANTIANRLLTTRLQLYDVILQSSHEPISGQKLPISVTQ